MTASGTREGTGMGLRRPLQPEERMRTFEIIRTHDDLIRIGYDLEAQNLSGAAQTMDYGAHAIASLLAQNADLCTALRDLMAFDSTSYDRHSNRAKALLSAKAKARSVLSTEGRE